MTILGIDPGKSGAVAVLDESLVMRNVGRSVGPIGTNSHARSETSATTTGYSNCLVPLLALDQQF
jgi:hypothetical protein